MRLRSVSSPSVATTELTLLDSYWALTCAVHGRVNAQSVLRCGHSSMPWIYLLDPRRFNAAGAVSAIAR